MRVSPSFSLFCLFIFPDIQNLCTADGSIRAHWRTPSMPTLAAPRRPSPQTAAFAASQPSLSQRPQSLSKTRWATAGCTRSGQGSWSCVSSCFCWYCCAGVHGGRPPTNARGPRANSLGSECELGVKPMTFLIRTMWNVNPVYIHIEKSLGTGSSCSGDSDLEGCWREEGGS